MIEVVIFGFDGNNILFVCIFYKKNVFVLCGSFCLVIKVNMDMYEKLFQLYLNENKVDLEKILVIFEIILFNF